VIRRFYVHNFRCLQNFELRIAGQPSVLLIGKNGSGKTTVGSALEVLQQIARGTNRVSELIGWLDVMHAGGRPTRFELEVELASNVYEYVVAFSLTKPFGDLRVVEEKLTAGGKLVFARAQAKDGEPEDSAKLSIDWHLVALPIIQEGSSDDPLFIFKRWLARMLILRPLPALIDGYSEEETLEPSSDVSNFGAWFSGVLALAPAAYRTIDEHLKGVMPDLYDIKNPIVGDKPKVGDKSRSILVQFRNESGSLTLPFWQLSDGEKCFMICALVLASNDTYGPLLCFWDEPDNYLAPSEVGHFVMTLRRAFQSSGQFIATSHNPEAIRRFSDENTLVLYRKSHLEPTIVRPLSELKVNGDLIGALIRDDLEP
jgi:predicted ATPase